MFLQRHDGENKGQVNTSLVKLLVEMFTRPREASSGVPQAEEYDRSEKINE